jgi:phospholipid-binding lipoprotein MlaA
MQTRYSFLIIVGAALALSGCASQDPEALAQHDPWESSNRAVFDFDIKLNNAPVVFVNDSIQGDGTKATDTFGRFLINSTVGVAGLIDVASKIGIPYHDNDFGITLGKGGAAEGSYLVLPFLGPKPPRDLVGSGVDIAFDPLTYITWNNSTLYTMIRAGLTVLDSSAANIDAVESIQRSSIDFYATTRSLYRQNRNAQIHDGAGQNSDLPNF